MILLPFPGLLLLIGVVLTHLFDSSIETDRHGFPMRQETQSIPGPDIR